jgi:HK97 family phage major capsid protein
MKKSRSETIDALRDTIKEKTARMDEVMSTAADESRSTTEEESEEFENLEAEVKSLRADLRRHESLLASDLDGAKAVSDKNPRVPGTGREPATIKTVEKLEPGIQLARYAMCLGKAKGNHQLAFQLAERHYPNTSNVVNLLKHQAEGCDLASLMNQKAMNPEMFAKATVAAGDTINSTWAAPLVYANTFAGDFIEYLRPRTLIGQANFRRVPFNVRIAGQTSGGTAGWVGQGKAKPVTKFDYNATTIPFTKIAAIAVLTQELIRFSDPSAEALVRDSLADTVIERIDSDLFDPDKAAVANVSPAGLLNGVAPVQGPTGSDPDDIRCALLRLWAPWDSTNLGARPAYYTTPAVARFLAFSRDALGNPGFPGVTPFGGTLDGIPLRVSNYLANNGGSAGSPFILVDESEVFLADDGNVTLDASEQATIEMSDTPAGSSNPTVVASSTLPVSMWQTNSVALRAERFIWWGLRRTGAINWIDGFPSSC